MSLCAFCFLKSAIRYLGHPNGKVAQASHSMFASFISSGKHINEDERASMKEQLVFYYMERSLMVYCNVQNLSWTIERLHADTFY